MNFPFLKSIFGLLTLIIFCCCGSDKNTDGGLLWRITGNGLQEPSYLFGTNHGMSGDFLNQVPHFFEVLDSVKQLAVESDPATPGRLDLIKPVNKYLSPQFSYRDLLNEDEIAVLDTLLSRYAKVDSEKINSAPFHLLINLQMGITRNESLKWAEVNPYLRMVDFSRNIDSRILKIAKFRSYPIVELDSEEEMDRLGLRDWSILFSSDDLQVQAKEVIRALVDLEKDSLIAITKKGQEAYYAQDLNSTGQWSTHPKLLKDKKAEEIYYNMCTARNIFWIERIVSAIEQQPTMIAVGVGHLPGEKGVINLLRDQGFTVQPVE
ncbi:TraB/GumN family protein [Sunxiuqinia dokdonensis]|uniref:GumN family protein n=1 Tax=Sunxiuqinia dokdonensis TaxID=1409788 RepID=A0A0L8V7J7_9BACT|nr:TraB/GumN family protein [Sunxiuqinia dokdonensis]KOH44460.1 hypothetical protein NC99_26900 [Sunxiuqinia dokdonensis]